MDLRDRNRQRVREVHDFHIGTPPPEALVSGHLSLCTSREQLISALRVLHKGTNSCLNSQVFTEDGVVGGGDPLNTYCSHATS